MIFKPGDMVRRKHLVKNADPFMLGVFARYESGESVMCQIVWSTRKGPMMSWVLDFDIEKVV